MFNIFKKKETAQQTPARAYTVNVTKEGVFVDGIPVSPMTLPSLRAVFGEPRIVPPREEIEDKYKKYTAIWDEAGVRGYIKDLNKGDINSINILLCEDPEWNPKYDKEIHHPHSPFSGTFLMNGKPAIQAFSEKVLQDAYIFIETKLGNWRASFQLTKAMGREIKDDGKSTEHIIRNKGNASELIRNADTPFMWADIIYVAPRISTGKYLHKKPEGEILAFKNLNFKLAIVEELMYNRHLIEPAFDVHDFAKDYAKREIDVDSEGYEMIPEVRKWFRDLPVSAALAEKVETLYLDGGNAVYGQICPFWDGEDEMYDLKAITPEELSQFPNLTRIDTPGIGLSPKVRKLLKENGIEVNDI
jgi:hypothetical protein